MAKKKPTKKTNKRESESLYKGVIEITRSGMGYVIVDKLDKDIMVRPNDFATALHGDLVRVKIVKDNAAARRMQGKVVEVVSRKQMEFLGRIEMSRGFAFFIPDTDKPMPDIYIPLDALNGAEDNQRVVARITRWETNKKPEGEVVELLDATTESDLAMKDILLKAGFPLSFSDDAMEEAARLPETVTEDDLQNRRDLRDILTFTIDPVDAKDFDDALSFRKFKNGKMEIGVHIAD
ncbi:MAG TPA: RNB domain-containing ribonuclease, partial [Parasegetibacter sp.]